MAAPRHSRGDLQHGRLTLSQLSPHNEVEALKTVSAILLTLAVALSYLAHLAEALLQGRAIGGLDIQPRLLAAISENNTQPTRYRARCSYLTDGKGGVYSLDQAKTAVNCPPRSQS